LNIEEFVIEYAKLTLKMKCTYQLQYLYLTNRDTHDKHTFNDFKKISEYNIIKCFFQRESFSRAF